MLVQKLLFLASLKITMTGEWVGWMPWNLPHSLQLGHRGDDGNGDNSDWNGDQNRTTVTWVWTRTTAGWATGARTKALEGVLPILVRKRIRSIWKETKNRIIGCSIFQDLAAATTVNVRIAPALKRTPRSAHLSYDIICHWHIWIHTRSFFACLPSSSGLSFQWRKESCHHVTQDFCELPYFSLNILI